MERESPPGRWAKTPKIWAMHVKALEMPGYEPRSLKTMALGLAVSTRGACHNRSSAYEADFSDRVDRLEADALRGRITADGEDFSVILDSLIWCKFLRKAFDDFWGRVCQFAQTSSPAGTSPPPNSSGQASASTTSRKLFNIREGWTRPDDTLPARVLSEPLSDGVAAGIGLTKSDLDMMIAAYYQARDWNPDGTIPDEKLLDLELTASTSP